MKVKLYLALWVVIFLFCSSYAKTPPPEEKNYDIVIVGGSSGAFGAAIGAARSGASVVLIEDTPVLGGMLSNGISNIDCYSYESLSGVFDEFRERVKAHYKPIMDTDPVFKFRLSPPRPENSFTDEERATRRINAAESRARQTNEAINGGRWEPHVADKIFKEMASAYPNLTIFYNRYASGVVKSGNRIIGVKTKSPKGEDIHFYGKIVIDATHEGDVAAWAGAPYRIGREARSSEEPHAGEIYYYNSTGEIIRKGSGRQDLAIPSYGIRLCIQHYDPSKSKDHILASPPPDYDPKKYKYAQYADFQKFEPTMPGMKTEMNKNPVGNELQEVNWSWPEANYEERRKLYTFYKNHALGFLYYLQHEIGIRNIGLPKDEFLDNDNIPYRVFVREARRIVGRATLNEADINPFIKLNSNLTPPFQTQSVAIGHYPIDAKPVRQKTDVSTPDKGEGDFFLSNVISPFQIPYGALLPQNVEGLIVPVAMSATHVAFSAIRMDATWMAMGQAAGVAAGMSVKSGVPIDQIDVRNLQKELLAQKCKLVFYWDVSKSHPQFEAVQKAAIKEWFEPDFSRDFYPDSVLTRGEAARWLIKAFDLWPSVSNVHFSDVFITHPAFQAVETLFDYGVLEAIGVSPRWSEAGGYAEKNDGFDHRKSNFGPFYPEKPISTQELNALIERIRHLGVANVKLKPNSVAQPSTSRSLTRAEGLELLWEHIEFE